jgi:hypothetical protein
MPIWTCNQHGKGGKQQREHIKENRKQRNRKGKTKRNARKQGREAQHPTQD